MLTEFPFCLVGKSEQEARKMCVDENWIFRVIERNNVQQSVRKDARLDRISVAIENGMITRAYIG